MADVGADSTPEPVPEEPQRVQLQKYLAACGVASRREAERMIAEGRVCVNGVPATPGAAVNPDGDEVTVDGEALERDRKLYLALYKPAGVLSTTEATPGQRTLLDCLGEVEARVFPVGRLDKEAEGLMLMTNDGELAFRLTLPECDIERVYIVRVEGVMADEAVAALKAGVLVDDAVATAKVTVLDAGLRTTLVRMALFEDKKRKVRPMCMAVGHPVCEMRRVAMGGVHLEDLKSGEWRYLTNEEVGELRALAGLGK